MGIAQRATAEAVGTALLLATVVGSGIMGERLADGNVALALLANSLATGAGLVALILTFGPISGAHFNPAVTPGARCGRYFRRHTARRVAAIFVSAQLLGAAAATLLFRWSEWSSSRVDSVNACANQPPMMRPSSLHRIDVACSSSMHAGIDALN